MLRSFHYDYAVNFDIFKRIAKIFFVTNLDSLKVECCGQLLNSMACNRKPVAIKKQQFFYAVGIGRRTGVFNAWSEIEPLVKGITNAKFRKFPTYQEAKDFVEQHASPCRSSPYKPGTPPVTPPQFGSQNNRFASSSSIQHVQEKARNMSALFQSQPLQSTSDTTDESEEYALFEEAEAQAYLMLSNQKSSSSTSPTKSIQLPIEFQLDTFQKRLANIEKNFHDVVEEKINEIDKLKQEFSSFKAELSANKDHEPDLKRTLARLKERKQEIETSNPTKKAKMIEVDNAVPGTSSGSTGDCSNNFVFDQEGYCIVFTDGACTKNGQSGAKAGIGIWFGPNHPLNTGDPLRDCSPTNNNAEIQAASFALNASKLAGLKKVAVHTDSKFVIDCTTNWIHKWKQNGWKKADGKPIINKAQLQVLEDAKEGLDVKWVHVRGHSNILGNEMADRLANVGAAKYGQDSP